MMAKKKKNILAMPDKHIGFKELIEVRKSEMSGCLPGMTTKVSRFDAEAWVSSPKTFERTLFTISNN